MVHITVTRNRVTTSAQQEAILESASVVWLSNGALATLTTVAVSETGMTPVTVAIGVILGIQILAGTHPNRGRHS